LSEVFQTDKDGKRNLKIMNIEVGKRVAPEQRG